MIRRLSAAAALLTLALIVAGGVVTNTDSGLACPDWPTCYGSVVPPMVGNVAVEHTHRLVATAVGLLVAIPAPDDLIEVRRAGRDRVARTIETFAHGFRLLTKRRTTSTAELDSVAVHDLLISIYRPMRSEPVEASRVTFSLDLLLFRAGK